MSTDTDPNSPPAGDPHVRRLISEEREHLKKAVRAAETSGPTGVAREAVAHAREQVQRAVTIHHYEQVLDAALRNLDLDALFPEILGRIRNMLEADEATIFLLEDSGDYLYARASVGMQGAVDRGVRIPVGEGTAGAVLASRKSLTLYEVNDETVADSSLLEMGIKSLVTVPLLVADSAIGVLTVGCVSGRDYEPHEVRLLEVVADRVALAIERTRILAEVQVERERAERASRFKTTLLHMASHDIRTPLTALTLQVANLKSPTLAPGARAESLAIVERSVRRLGLMLDDFLDLARSEAGHLTLETAPVDLLQVAREAVAMLAPLAAQRGLSLTVAGEAVVVEADERRLMQVLVNLVTNALRYTPHGSVALSVARGVRKPAETDAPEAAPAVALLTVQDTGRGISAEQARGLFQPFSQMHSGPQEGTGLGLHLAKTIVDAHGGELRVTSEGKDRGTQVVLELPIERRVVDAAAEVATVLEGDAHQEDGRKAPSRPHRPRRGRGDRRRHERERHDAVGSTAKQRQE